MKRLVTSMALLGLLFVGCLRGTPSDKPPIHLNPNMDEQPRYDPQEKSIFFADSATMRVPPAGTVARGFLREDSAYYQGKNSDGSLIVHDPVPVTMQELRRGEERFNIYCSPCHSRLGDGKGIVTQRGLLPPPTFHDDRLRQAPDGHFFDVITNGLRNMPPYRFQIPVEDRWAIIAYVRALQRSQTGTANDVPQQMRGTIR